MNESKFSPFAQHVREFTVIVCNDYQKKKDLKGVQHCLYALWQGLNGLAHSHPPEKLDFMLQEYARDSAEHAIMATDPSRREASRQVANWLFTALKHHGPHPVAFEDFPHTFRLYKEYRAVIDVLARCENTYVIVAALKVLGLKQKSWPAIDTAPGYFEDWGHHLAVQVGRIYDGQALFAQIPANAWEKADSLLNSTFKIWRITKTPATRQQHYTAMESALNTRFESIPTETPPRND